MVHRSGPGSALARDLQPELAAWASGTVTADLLAHVVDLLAAANWQRQGKKTAAKPKPLPRPGRAPADGQRYGSAPIPVGDFDDWWNNPESG